MLGGRVQCHRQISMPVEMEVRREGRRAGGRALNAVLFGSFVALAIQSGLTLLLLAAQQSGLNQVAIVGLASFTITSVAGFLFIGRYVTVGRAVVIGIVYFPTMFGLMFLEAVVLDARLYGNTF